MTLFEVDQRLFDLVDPETGELTDYEAFAALQMEREEKIENAVLYVKNLDAEAKAIREEEKLLAERRRVKEARASRLRDYIQQALCGEKFETARCAVSYRKTTALGVEDNSAAVLWLEENGYRDLVVYGAPTMDKRSVTALLKSGTEIPGLSLEERQSMQVK